MTHPEDPVIGGSLGSSPGLKMTTFGLAVDSVHIKASCWTPGSREAGVGAQPGFCPSVSSYSGAGSHPSLPVCVCQRWGRPKTPFHKRVSSARGWRDEGPSGRPVSQFYPSPAGPAPDSLEVQPGPWAPAALTIPDTPLGPPSSSAGRHVSRSLCPAGSSVAGDRDFQRPWALQQETLTIRASAPANLSPPSPHLVLSATLRHPDPSPALIKPPPLH